MLRRLIVLLGLAMVCATPALAQDAADVIVRLNRMESQFRQMSGQIEQLQYENRQLKEQVRKFQEDVEYRFQENKGGARPSATPARPATPAQPQKRSDLFDPSEAPEAPGAPRPLGSVESAAPPGLETYAGSTDGIGQIIEQDDPYAEAAPMDLNPASRTASVTPRTAPSVAAAGTGDPRSDYEAAFALYSEQQYEQAEMGFRKFLQSNPRDKMVPEAAYWLGESYLQRKRYREAAEQFLTVSADYPNAPKAPDALLRLGVSLNAIGAKDRACAVFSELGRKYPQAPASVRQSNEREQKRARCA
jgi:tol-pal system protein YbgF